MRDEIDELEDQIIGASDSEVVKLTCPVCGKGLLIFFTPGDRRALNVHCNDPKCLSFHVDGLAAVPPWTAVLGNRVQTAQTG